MALILIKRYHPEAEPLKKLIKYFWVLESDRGTNLNHKKLPVNNIDMIFNFLAPMRFEKEGMTHETPGNIFFSGLTGKHVVLKQQGLILTIGVAFFPAGFYPFFGIPVSEFKNHTIGLDAILNKSATEFEERLGEAGRVSGKIALIENFFLERLDQNTLPARDTGMLVNRFCSNNSGVRDFCGRHGVHPRKLERLFNKYVGVAPKQFRRLSRFQSMVNRLLGTSRENLTTLAHEFEFYDQTHFIKDFKAFAGSSPSKFLKEKRSLKQIMKISPGRRFHG